MGKYLLGLVGAGVLAFMVKTAADEAGKNLAAVRQEKPAAPAKPRDPGTVVSFEDPLGCYRVMVPREPDPMSPDGYWMHGIGRGAYVYLPEEKTRFQVTAAFVGSDEPNTPRQTLTWVVKKDIGRSQQTDHFDRVKFSRSPAGAEVSDFEYAWRGNSPSAHRTRHVLYRKWVYTLTVYGLPDGLETPEILSFFDTFALTEKALDHPDGGVLKP